MMRPPVPGLGAGLVGEVSARVGWRRRGWMRVKGLVCV